MSLQSQVPNAEIYEFKRLYLIAYIFKEVPGPVVNSQTPHAILQLGSRVAGKLPLEKDLGVLNIQQWLNIFFLARCSILPDLKHYAGRLISDKSIYVIVIIPKNKTTKKPKQKNKQTKKKKEESKLLQIYFNVLVKYSNLMSNSVISSPKTYEKIFLT